MFSPVLGVGGEAYAGLLAVDGGGGFELFVGICADVDAEAFAFVGHAVDGAAPVDAVVDGELGGCVGGVAVGPVWGAGAAADGGFPR